MKFSNAQRPIVVAEHPELKSKVRRASVRITYKHLITALVRVPSPPPHRPHYRHHSLPSLPLCCAQVTEIAKIIGAKWKALTDEQKASYA